MKLDERIFLVKTIKLLRRKQLTYIEIFQELKDRNILPKNWEDADKIRKFYSRCKNLVDPKEGEQINTNVDILEFIKPLVKNVQVHYTQKFEIYFGRLTELGKKEFFEWLAVPYIQKGVPVCDICNAIVQDFQKLGLLSDGTIRTFMPNKFKNMARQKNRLGKTRSDTND